VVRASADALSGALQELVARLDGSKGVAPGDPALQDVAGTLGAVGDAVNASLDGLTTQAGSLLDGVEVATTELATRAGDLLTGTVDALGETVDTGMTQVAETATNLTGSLVDTAGELATGAGDLLADTGDALGGTIDTSLGQVAQTATTVTGSLIDTVTDLTGIGGSDPAGGIATLTGMLSEATGFEVVTPDAPEAAPIFASVDLPDAIDAVAGGVNLSPDDADGGLLDNVVEAGTGLLGDHHGLGGLLDGDHAHG
jgi:hypothetical protein